LLKKTTVLSARSFLQLPFFNKSSLSTLITYSVGTEAVMAEAAGLVSALSELMSSMEKMGNETNKYQMLWRGAPVLVQENQESFWGISES
jgi:hypothetical protein